MKAIGGLKVDLECAAMRGFHALLTVAVLLWRLVAQECTPDQHKQYERHARQAELALIEPQRDICPITYQSGNVYLHCSVAGRTLHQTKACCAAMNTEKIILEHS